MALRWMNPNAVIYLREIKGQGKPYVEYALCEFPHAPARLPRLASLRPLNLPGPPHSPPLAPQGRATRHRGALT
jgi:hypothetical protein